MNIKTHAGKKAIYVFLPLIFLISFLIPSQIFAQAKTVTGKVIGSDGTPIAGVTVLEKGPQPEQLLIHRVIFL